MITIALCDDEPFMLENMYDRLVTYLNNKSFSHRLLCFSSGSDLLQCEQEYDILFLDIQMDGPDGMKTAKLLRERGFGGLIIFMTVLKEHVFDAFQVEAFDYLIKPTENDRLLSVLDRALNTLFKKRQKNIVIQKGNTTSIIFLDDILYGEVMGRKIYLYTKDGQVADYYGSLEDLEQNMDSRFFRCHRSYLINLDYVRGIKDQNATLSGGKNVPVSRLREQHLSQVLLSHMKRRRY